MHVTGPWWERLNRVMAPWAALRLPETAHAVFAGTYFPPRDMPGRPSFVSLLQRIRQVRHQQCGKALARLCVLKSGCRLPQLCMCIYQSAVCPGRCANPPLALLHMLLTSRDGQVWEQQQEEVLDSSADTMRQLTEAMASTGMPPSQSL